MPTREEEYMRVRTLLDFPREQRPSPHSIFDELIRAEQFQANRLNMSARAWTQGSTSVTTVADQADYTITAADFGKPLFAYRSLSNNIVLPVPFTDFVNEVYDQNYDFFVVPTEADEMSWENGQKIAFFRQKDGTKKLRIYPTPDTAGDIFYIVYASGWNDWTAFALGDTPIMPEWSDHRTLKVALVLLARAEWDGYVREEASLKRRELREALEFQFAEQEQAFDRYVRSGPQHDPISEVPAWYD